MAIFKLDHHYEEREQPIYSSYQTNIFGAIRDTKDNLIIEAVAGSGKTTTIVEGCRLLPKRGDNIFLAFNKNIADELSSKLPPHIPGQTLHSLCLGILRRNFSKVKVSANRVSNMLANILKIKTNYKNKQWYYDNRKDVCRVVSRMKAMGRKVPDRQEIYELCIGLNVDFEPGKWEVDVIFQLFWECIVFDGKYNHEIDFDDMIYHVITKHETLDIKQFDNVVVDEAQDLNMGQRMLLHLILKQSGRLIAVGDSKQSIYGFRGADHNSMLHIKEEFDCTELPLSISYRCSRAIVEAAQHFVPAIEARDGAPDGRVSRVLESDYRFLIEPGNMLLCRTWAPLVCEAMSLAYKGHNVCILGNDIAPSLKKWAKSIANMHDSIQKSTVWDHHELQVAGIPEGQEWREYHMKERSQMIAYICGNGILTLKEVEDVISEIFTDKPPLSPHVLLSTIHRVKGMEAERVFLLRPDLLPHPLACGHHELLQEDNLHYVAITRAKEQVWYIVDED